MGIIRIAAGVVAGALVGLAVYKFIGCRTGTCPLTGNPFIAMFIWGLLGAIIMAGK
ncbi:MAG: hypothetical protein KJ626_11050 [Verrucomicrobia bacterium]|nr:hypothetical protein [Verrucomicrobiota bacterium]